MITGGPQVSFQIDANLNQYVEQGAGAPPGTLKELVNLRKDRDGKLVKRQGYCGTTATGNSRGAVRGFEHSGQPILIDDTSVMAYGESQDKWRIVDRATNWTLDGTSRITGDTSGWASDVYAASQADRLGFKLYPALAVGGGIVVHAWIWKQWNNQQSSVGILNFPGPDVDLHGVYIMVRDEKTGAVLRGPERVDGGAVSPNIFSMVRIAYSGGYFWIAWSLIPKYGAGAGTGTISAMCVTVAQLTGTSALPAGTALKGDLQRSDLIGGTEYHASWDLCAGGTLVTPSAFLAYARDNAGARNLSVCTVTTTPAVGSSVTMADGAARAISVAHKISNGYFWVAYALIANPKVLRITPFPTTLTGTIFSLDLATSSYTVVSTGLIPHHTDGTKVLAAANTQEPTSLRSGGIMWRFAANASGVPGTSGVTHEKSDVVMGSQPFHNGRDFFVWGEIGGQAENMAGAPNPIDPSGPEELAHSSAVLIALTHDGGSMYSDSTFLQTVPPHLRVQAGRTNWGQYADLWFSQPYATFQAPQRVAQGSLDTATYFWDGSIVLLSTGNPAEFGHNIGYGPTGIVEHKFRNATPGGSSAHMPSDSGAGLMVTSGGSILNAFDGQQLTELGFCQPPRIDSVDPSSAGNATITGGDYQWAVVYEYTDSAGNIHQSLPRLSPVTAVTANHKTTLVVRTLKVTRKQDYERRIRGTATVMKPDTEVQIVVYRSGVGPTPIFYRTASAVNDPNQETMSIVDDGGNASIESGPILYTSIGELVNECPPPARHAVTVNNRIAAIDAETEGRIYFSKPLRVGQGPAFSGVLETYVRDIGKLTALAAMDGTLYAFSATGIAVAAFGDGQDATGTGSWPQPQVISRAAGCVDARALCATQDGIVFVSQEADTNRPRFSIWLLPRGGGNIVEIGRPVYAYLTATVLGATPSSVIGVDNWVAESRVVFTLKYSNTATIELEYDYGNRNADGLGVWNVSFVLAGTFLIGTTWVSGGQHWLANSATTGYVMRSKANVYCDTAYTGSTETWIQYIVETQPIKLGSLAPRGKLNSILAEFSTWYNSDNPRTSYVKWTVSSDAYPSTTTMVIDANDYALATSTGYFRAKREWQPPVRRDDMGMGVTLRLESVLVDQVVDNQDMIPLLVHLDYIAAKGLWRPTAGQRV